MTFEAKARFVDTEEFKQLLSKNKLVVAQYTASWCAPCRLVIPLIDKLAVEYGDRVKILKIDVDRNPNLVKKYNVRSIPAVLIFCDRQAVESVLGIKPYETYSNVLETQLRL